MRTPTPLFDGTPYLVTLIARSMYHLALVPQVMDVAALAELARAQVRTNRLQSCLVVARDRALYVGVEGDEQWSPRIPYGALPVAGKLRLARPLPMARDLDERRQRLAAYLRRHAISGYALGDLSKGGRTPTAEERVRLAGHREDGVRQGLDRCDVCGDWRGHCLDEIHGHGTLVVRVDCPCANDNRCARCGSLLAAHRLNSNNYDAATDAVWYVPGFCGLNHRCAGDRGNTEDVRYLSSVVTDAAREV